VQHRVTAPSRMHPVTRQLSVALVLLLVFLAAALAAQTWLERETRRVHVEAIAAKRAQFLKALELLPRPPANWDGDDQRDLGALLGATVSLVRGNEAAPSVASAKLLSFDCPLPGDAGFHARVTFAAPAAGRLSTLHQLTLVAVLLLALLFLMISVLLARPRRPAEADDGSSRPPWLAARTEMRGLEQLARVSVERGEALARESGARHRAEEDLKLSQTLLDRSRDERVRLGRDLHDNICQTLYAVSLTLEGLRGQAGPGGAGVAAQRLDQSIAELRRLNHEVRAYLKELEPATVHRPQFLEVLESMLAAQVGAATVRLVRNLDAEAVARIPPEQAAEVVSILREAISNSLRHSRAAAITVHAWRGDDSVMLAVQDDGAGFDPAAAGTRGHGLANMQARAEALGGALKLVSAPGNGTRVLLTLPVTSAP
jgi:two-component system, NarL family, sensor histidine kinase DevS